ncbi:MAG: hypothetical protein F6J93_18925 [Oscillatoria sp. SIO1A7]|nr:hypothetical protein [Oscillatoria sp. SIO1A7]
MGKKAFASFYMSLGAKGGRFTEIADFVTKLYIDLSAVAALQMWWLRSDRRSATI